MSDTVDIFTVSGGRKVFVGLNLPKDKLAVYSDLARSKYFQESGATWKAHSKRQITTKAFDLGLNMHEEFARTIVSHIRKADVNDPAPVTADLFGDNLTFEELVALYKLIGNGFKIPRNLHQDSVREKLRLQIYKNDPFTFANFKLITDQIAFDRGIFYCNMDRAAFLEQKEELDEEVKRQITEYCKSQEGIWESLLEVVGSVQDKIKAAGEGKEARLKAQASVLQRMKEKFDAGSGESHAQEKGAQTSGSKSIGSKKNTLTAGASKASTPKASASKPTASKASDHKGKSKKVPKQVEPFVKREENFPPLG